MSNPSRAEGRAWAMRTEARRGMEWEEVEVAGREPTRLLVRDFHRDLYHIFTDFAI